MAQQSLKAKAQLADRKLDGTLGDPPQDVYARRITNDDLRRKDEMDDEIAELRRAYIELAGADTPDGEGGVIHVDGEIDDCDNRDERLELRARARGIADEMRRLDARLLSVYVETATGDAFPGELLEQTDIRTLTALTRQATEYTYGRGDDDPGRPTRERNGSG